jgi:hypothetical protein
MIEIKLLSLCIGAFCAGFQLPELLNLLSHRSLHIPYAMNVMNAIAAAAITYGLAA